MKRLQGILLLMTFSCELLAQLSSTTSNVDTAWVRHYPASWAATSGYASAMKRDGLGNIYITGNINDDICTIKFSPNGDSLWSHWYAGTGNEIDRGIDLAIDGDQCVYVTGSVANDNRDYVTIKYDSDGNTVWARQYNGTVNVYDAPSTLALDGNGNPYVFGLNNSTIACAPSGGVHSIIKYDTAGILQWRKEFLGPLGDFDTRGHLFVAGRIHVGDNNDDILIAKLNVDGDTVWTRQFGGIWFDEPHSLTVDQSCNVYVSGSVDQAVSVSAQGCILGYGGGVVTIKYDSSGNLKWIAPYGSDGSNTLKVDRSGNLCVARNYSSGYLTTKLSSNGDTLWTRIHETTGNGSVNSLVLDDQNGVYVTGTDLVGVATVKYDNAGNKIWSASYYDPTRGVSVAGIDVDVSGNVFVAGTSLDQPTYFVIKYVQMPTEVNEQQSTTPTAFFLSQNYPNPFNPSTEVIYHLPSTVYHSLKIFDLLGREVAVLVNEEKPAGSYTATWNAAGMSSGVYFCRLTAGPSTSSGREFVETKKMILMR